METKQLQTAALYTDTLVQYNGASSQSQSLVKDWSLYLQPRLPIVRGDHNHPNGWSYRREERHLAKGSISATSRPGWTYNEFVDGEFVAKQHQDANYLVGSFGENMSPFIDYDASSEIDAAYNEALSRLNDQIRGGLDLSVDAFQAKQTKDMFKAAGKMNAWVENQTSLFRKKVSVLKSVGSAWLELQYGWKPLLSDIYGIADETLRFELNKEREFKASANVPFRQVYTTSGHVGLGRRTHVIRGKASCRIGVTMRVDNDVDLARWSSLNPLSIGWELLPYSFVVDWLYDVGGTLRAAETALAYNNRFKYGYVSRLITGDENCTNLCGGEPYAGDYIVSFSLAWSRKVSDFTRDVLGAYPFPRPPVFKGPLSSGHLLNLAGLVSQFLKKGAL